MHETLFADAFRPPRFIVLDLPLLDYTIGHELILFQRRNALVYYNPKSFDELPLTAKAEALTQAVLLCCVKSPRFRRWWVCRSARLDFNQEVEKFQSYRLAGSQDFPTVRMPRAGGAPFHYLGAPELARLINYVTASHSVMIQTHFGGSPLNFPLGLARMLYLASAEAAGNIWIENFQDADLKRQKDALEKKSPESTLAIGEEAVQKLAEEWNRQHPNSPVTLMHDPQKEKQ